jgi:hypothetical protein
MSTNARSAARPAKTCQRCGRVITWRKKWARDWDAVRYCSAACRRPRRTGRDAKFEKAILNLLRTRPRSSSICPSEVARLVANPEDAVWAAACEQARQAARRLVSRGQVEITQMGRVVDPSHARGPLRIRRPQGR